MESAPFVPAVPVASSPAPLAAPAPSPAPTQRFSELLSTLAERIDRGERLAERAVHAHGPLDAAQLIALQTGIYRYAEAVELSAKLVDRATQAVRTTVQSQ